MIRESLLRRDSRYARSVMFHKMKIFKILILLFFIIGCQNNKHMKNQQKEKIVNYVNSYNSFDIDGMIKDLDENVVFENVTNGKVDLRTEGIDEFKKQAESAKQYFQHRKQIIDSWEFNNSTVEIKINYNAILAIDFPNGLKKGDTLELNGISKFEFENDRIIKIKDKS